MTRSRDYSLLTSRLILFAIAFLVPLLIARQSQDLKLFATQPLAIAAFAALAVAVLAATRPDRLPAMALALLPFLAWPLILAAATLSASSPSAMDECVRQMTFIAIAIAASLAFRRNDGRRLASIWLGTMACVAAYAISQRLGYEPIEEFRRWHSQARVFSTFGNPSFLGTHTAFLLPLMAGLAMATTGRGRALAGAMTALTALILLWTFSRGAWLGAIAGLAVVSILSRNTLRRAIPPLPRFALGTALVLIVIVTVLALPREHLTRRTDRLMLWRGTLSMIREKPLTGWGIGAFPAEYPPFAPKAFAQRMKDDNTFAEHPHCEYLHVATETGILGLGLFAWLVAAIVRQSFRRARTGDRFAIGALGAIVAVLVHIAVDRNFRLASTAAPFWLLVGAMYARGTGAAPISPRTGLAVAVAAAIAIVTAAWTLRPLQAFHRVSAETDFLDQAAQLTTDQLESQRSARARDPVFHMEIGNAYAKERNFRKAAAAFRQALKLAPQLASAANNLGNSHFMMSEFDQAIAAYRKVLEVNPDDRDARFNMAFAYFHQRNIKQAMAECRTLLRQDPQNPKALQLMRQLAP